MPPILANVTLDAFLDHFAAFATRIFILLRWHCNNINGNKQKIEVNMQLMKKIE